MTDQPYHAIYLAPHYDDAAYSCGGQIFQRTRAGERVLIVTVMGREEPRPPLAPFARKFYEQCGLGENAVRLRKQEDERACRRLGADWLHLEFPEAVYRFDPAVARAIYPTQKAVLGRIHPADNAFMEALGLRLSAFAPAAEILAPLAVGGHVDHRILHAVARTTFGDRVQYYEDFQYCQRFLSVWKIVGPFSNLRWEMREIPLDKAAIQARCDAMAKYPSQMAAIFADRADQDFKVRRYIRRVGGERTRRRRG